MAQSESGSVVVLGGTGFLGRRVVRALLARGRAVDVGSRAPDRARVEGDARPVLADVRQRASLERAFEGAVAVVNCVGLYTERGADTFHAVHVEGARAAAEIAARQGAARLVHVSGIGADRASRAAYIRSRAEGEDAVRAAFPAATILRPSALFAEDGGLFAALAPIVAGLPVVPLFGDGSTRLQPVHADDVAEAAARALESGSAPGTVYELGGPEVFTYREMLERIAARAGRRRLFVPVPFALWRVLAAAASLLSNPPLTPAQVALMERDNVAGAGMPGLADLGITPRAASASGLV